MARTNNDFSDDFSDFNERGSGRELNVNFDLQHYLRILRKHKWPITLFSGAVTALAAYYAFTATPIYSSTSTLLIEQQKANIVSVEELYSGDTQNKDYYETQFELLKSRTLARKIIDKLDLWSNPELSQRAREAAARVDAAKQDMMGDIENGETDVSGISSLLAKIGLGAKPRPGDDVQDSSGSTSMMADSGFRIEDLTEEEKETVVSNFQKKLTITPVRKTKLVKLSYESADPVLAMNVANTVGEQYIESYLDAKMEMTQVASEWLGERLATLKGTLDESEQRLIEFKQANGLIDVGDSVARLNETELMLVTTELAQARSELAIAQDLYREVQAVKGNPDALEFVPGVQYDSLVQQVKVEQGQAQRNLDELKNRYGDRHPRVVDAVSQLTTLDSTLKGHVQRVVAGIEKDYQLKRQRVGSIEGKLASGKKEIQDIGTKKFELDALEREVATNQSIYETFFNRMSEAKSADGLETANARISDLAVIGNVPVKPKKQLIIALAALASLAMSMLMALLYEQMDDTVKGTADVESSLGVKLLGILPMIKNGMFSKGQHLPLNPANIEDKKGTFVEAVNTVRTVLCMDDKDDARKIIMVTSSVPGEGKSTASLNIAYSLAQMERVLLIDCDMRRPTIAKAAGIDRNANGLSNLITKNAAAKDCIYRGVFNGFVDVLPSGPIPDQPLELLSSKRFEKILAQLSEHYDRIIIDSAPTQAVSDALVLSKLVDGVVYAIKSHDTSIELVKRGLQRLSQVKAPLAGVLITQVDMDKITSYGGDYYYQGYYDYYGYREKGAGKNSGKLRLSQEELISIKSDDSDVNLDLDYGLETASVRNKPSRINRSQGRSNATQIDMDDSIEFDLTTQVNAPVIRQANGSAASRAPQRGNAKGGKRFVDDLDII